MSSVALGIETGSARDATPRPSNPFHYVHMQQLIPVASLEIISYSFLATILHLHHLHQILTIQFDVLRILVEDVCGNIHHRNFVADGSVNINTHKIITEVSRYIFIMNGTQIIITRESAHQLPSQPSMICFCAI